MGPLNFAFFWKHGIFGGLFQVESGAGEGVGAGELGGCFGVFEVNLGRSGAEVSDAGRAWAAFCRFLGFFRRSGTPVPLQGCGACEVVGQYPHGHLDGTTEKLALSATRPDRSL